MTRSYVFPGVRRPRLLLCLLGFLALGLGACDQGPATNTRFMHPSGALDFLVAATRNQGALHLEVRGAAFPGVPTAELPLVPVIEKAVQSRILKLTRTAATAENPRFRLLLLFNAPSSTEVLALCRGAPGGGPARSDGRVELLAAFCNGEQLVSAVHGWVEEAETPQGKRFEQLIRQTARDLFRDRRRDE